MTQAAPESPVDPVSPLTRTILAGIAMRAGSSLLKRGVDRGILGAAPDALKAAAKAAGVKAAQQAAKAPKVKRGIGARILTAAATRIATRSVPGAIVVGGALLAKTLHERRKNRQR
ncbi:hypothetical protein AQZ52_14585 [Novosphingobium fuchskuhlense]|uniref:Uncharacterized protein n=1 Tax=Novosphingobium fuchskuhlense TaxID=1117702 RepID=A0A117USM7_9SPHN|nr:hypothetical protein AQZ52_14585 [Novosphingobium fuchskuhlense]